MGRARTLIVLESVTHDSWAAATEVGDGRGFLDQSERLDRLKALDASGRSKTSQHQDRSTAHQGRCREKKPEGITSERCHETGRDERNHGTAEHAPQTVGYSCGAI